MDWGLRSSSCIERWSLYKTLWRCLLTSKVLNSNTRSCDLLKLLVKISKLYFLTCFQFCHKMKVLSQIFRDKQKYIEKVGCNHMSSVKCDDKSNKESLRNGRGQEVFSVKSSDFQPNQLRSSSSSCIERSSLNETYNFWRWLFMSKVISDEDVFNSDTSHEILGSFLRKIPKTVFFSKLAFNFVMKRKIFHKHFLII